MNRIEIAFCVSSTFGFPLRARFVSMQFSAFAEVGPNPYSRMLVGPLERNAFAFARNT